MRLYLVTMMACLVGCALTAPASAQSQRPLAADEFIQASSQFETGERLVGRTIPGSNSQELVTIGTRPVGNSIDGTTLGDRVSAQRPGQYNTYPYPASTQLRTVNPTFRQTAFQSPLINSSAIRTAQNCNCAPGTVSGFQVPANTVPNIQAAPLPAPQGRLYVPGTAVNGQSVSPPAFQVPQANYTDLNYAQPQTGMYARPLPPGTYLGRGIVGQPTAYVPGQSFRNVLRYIFP